VARLVPLFVAYRLRCLDETGAFRILSVDPLNGGSTMTVERRLDQLEKRNKRLTVALTMMAMVAITIQLSACGDDPAGPSTNCDVSDVKALAGRDLSGCDLVRADLSSVDLSGADLEGANLYDANLRNANLRRADLRSANLKSADLRFADLGYAILEGAILEGADLRYAILEGADLEGAILKYANLEGAKEVPEMDASQEETACWSDCG